MTRKETAKLVAILQVNYPDNFAGKSDELVVATIDLWARAFVDDDYGTVSAAVMAHIVSDTSRFMPPVGVIKAKIAELTKTDDMTEQEAWSLVAKALRNSAYGSEAEFAKLPPAVKRAVGNPAQLREWAMMDTDTVQSVVASNFQRSYRVAAQRERDWEKLPSGVKKYVGELTARMALGIEAPAEDDPEKTKQDAIRRLLDYPNT